MSDASSTPMRIAVPVLGVGQVLVWGSSYYLPAVLAKPTADATGWPLSWVIAGLSLGLLVSGIVSPKVGVVIERRGGRPVLTASAFLMGVGLFGLAVAPNLPIYILAWLVLGAAMGCGLYDPAFATLGRLYGGEARAAITSLTLIGGFASTVCWPLSAFLLARFGWRGTCIIYAALNLLLVLPLYRLGLRAESPKPAAIARRGAASRGHSATAREQAYVPVYVMVALSMTFASIIASLMSVHLLTLLQQSGMALGTAVAMGAIVGPCQVGARLIDLMAGRRVHPIWETILSSALVVLGLGLLLFLRREAALPGLILYGSGIGLRSIVRGTLPLALFGPEGYASLMGRLALPMLIGQAAAPSAGAVLLARFGAAGVLIALLVLAMASLVSSVMILPLLGRLGCEHSQ